MIDWSAVAAIGSILSAAVIAVSAILALRQVRQLQRATQLDGTMRVFAQFSDPEFIAARKFVFHELPNKLKDPAFVAEVKNYTHVDLADHPEYRVLLFLQIVGSLVNDGLVSGPNVYRFAQYSIIKSWEILEPVVRMQRIATGNPYMWGGADFLYENAKRWLAQDAARRNVVNPATGAPWSPDQLR
ncbi:MAG: hypothetical protein JO293_07880 [Candidatus Eremiobacteraeota bacterium]|nr:hypothetical protein [Candidatus Eremiobacteraeota bacterium]MBV8281559.1 hypothetical protein [Candidatus Eremiobacteraeota bacterium]